jgi:hypothetical protein
MNLFLGCFWARIILRGEAATFQENLQKSV